MSYFGWIVAYAFSRAKCVGGGKIDQHTSITDKLQKEMIFFQLFLSFDKMLDKKDFFFGGGGKYD